MLHLRVMATAYLMNNNEFLMMERSKNKKFAPNIWAGVGGHLEPEEVNDPEKACIREIFEETCITEKNITDLDLKYIILRRSKDEIRVQYVYFGNTSKREFVDTHEGKLFWINKDMLFKRKLSVTTEMTLRHYLEYGRDIKDVLVGVVSACDNKPKVNWTPVQDWEDRI